MEPKSWRQSVIYAAAMGVVIFAIMWGVGWISHRDDPEAVSAPALPAIPYTPSPDVDVLAWPAEVEQALEVGCVEESRLDAAAHGTIHLLASVGVILDSPLAMLAGIELATQDKHRVLDEGIRLLQQAQVPDLDIAVSLAMLAGIAAQRGEEAFAHVIDQHISMLLPDCDPELAPTVVPEAFTEPEPHFPPEAPTYRL